MRHHTKSQLLLFATFAAMVLIAVHQFHTSGREASAHKAKTQNLKEQYPIADAAEPESLDPEQRAKRLKRGKKYNQKHRVVGPQIVQNAEGYPWPANFPAMPVLLSDAIIIGKVSQAKAYLSEDANSVYSEFTVRIDEILKKDVSDLSKGGSLVTERKGGRVRYPSGQISWMFVVGQSMPQVGNTYVFFLKKSDGDEAYSILTGYEIGDNVRPLDYSPGVGFERYSRSDSTLFLDELREAITKCEKASGL